MGNRLDCEHLGNRDSRRIAKPAWVGARFLRHIRRPGAVLATMVAAAVSAGALYQAASTLWDRHRVAPPGRFVTVDGLRLHMLASGERRADGDPVVLLETGLGGMSSAWGWIQPEVARFAKVVSYDREGLGWSHADSAPPSAARHARTLHAMLEKAGLKPPYLLVGHSMGGLLIRVFHDLYPDEVHGVVLIDASHPDQRLRSRAIRDHMNSGFRILRAAPLLAGIGYVRISDFFASQAEGLPPLQLDQARMFLCSYSHLKTTDLEASNWDALCAEVRGTAPLGKKPLAVISAGEGARPGSAELQAELARLSSCSRHLVVKGADHVTLVTHRENALRVASEIRRLFQLTREPGGHVAPAPPHLQRSW
ncbi:MAG TPA: alpha/beta hydrolase [Geobacter sp.]|nr:alpha/beta hydrolase [Geobacter sp.]